MNAYDFYQVLRTGDDYREVFVHFGNDSYLIKGFQYFEGRYDEYYDYTTEGIIELYLSAGRGYSNLSEIWQVSDLKYKFNQINFDQLKNIKVVVIRSDLTTYEIGNVYNSVGEIVIETIKPESEKNFLEKGVDKVKNLFN